MTCSRCNGSGVILVYRYDGMTAPYAFRCKHDEIHGLAGIPFWESNLRRWFTTRTELVYDARIVNDAFESQNWDKLKYLLEVHRERIQSEYLEWKTKNRL